MTISSTSNKASFNGSGTTGPFAFTFKTFTEADLEVISTDLSDVEATLVLTTDYTVSLNADQNNNPGGSVTTISVVASGYKLTIVRNVDALQETDITNGGGFYPEVVENALDRLTMLSQQNAEILTRAVTVPVSSAVAPIDYLATMATYASAAAASAAAIASGSQTITNIVCSGGVINGTAIGGSTPSSGQFSTLQVTGSSYVSAGASAGYFQAMNTGNPQGAIFGVDAPGNAYAWNQRSAASTFYLGNGSASNSGNVRLYSYGVLSVLVEALASADRYLTIRGGVGASASNVKLSANGGSLEIPTKTLFGSYPANAQYLPCIAAREAGASFEFGHWNSAGYGSVIGATAGSGQPYIAFNCGPGTTANKFKTLGRVGAVIASDNAGQIQFQTIDNASLDDQTPVTRTWFPAAGGIKVVAPANNNALTLMGRSADDSCTLSFWNNVESIESGRYTSTASEVTMRAMVAGGVLSFRTNSGLHMRVLDAVTPTNYLTISGGVNPTIGTSAGSLGISANIAQVVTGGGDYAMFQSSAAGSESALRIDNTQATSGSSLKISNSGLNYQSTLRLDANGALNFYVGQTAGAASTGGYIGFQIRKNASAVNNIFTNPGATLNPPVIGVMGETNVDLAFSPAGTGALRFFTNGATVEQVQITHTATATRYLTLTGSNGANPTIGTSAGSLAISTQMICNNGVYVSAGTANPAGGSTGVALYLSSGNIGILVGSGVPSATPADGSIYIRTDGGAGTTIYQRRAAAWVATAA
jgi:hypothetical protein